MAEHVIGGVLFASMALASAAAHAQALSDPMRPPAAAAAPASPAPAKAPRLESILIAPGRQLAVIDGRTVGIGERIGGATLVSVAPTEVVLQRGAQREVLKIHPGIEKRP